MRRFTRWSVALGAPALALAMSSLGVVGAAPASASQPPIVIGYVSDLTGFASSTFADGAKGAQARIDLQNAEGGVDGRKLKLVVEDDQSSPTTNQLVSQDLVQNKHVFGVVNFSAFAFGGAPYLQKEGIPVTGEGFDGPEWGAQPYTNMFDTGPPVDGPIAGKYYTSTIGGEFLKSLGVTKLAALGYGISASSQASIQLTLAAAKQEGISNCYENESVPFGTIDFTADVLQIKQAGCNGVVASFVDSSDIALSQAIKNAGIHPKQMYFTGYDEDVLSTPSSTSAFDGAYLGTPIIWSDPSPGVKAAVNTLKKYDPQYKGGIPDLGLIGSYESTDLMIFGLQHAGKHPTPQSFITNLRKVSGYTANGLIPEPGTTFKHFATAGMLPKKLCEQFVQLQNGKFVVVDHGKQFCGTWFSIPA